MVCDLVSRYHLYLYLHLYLCRRSHFFAVVVQHVSEAETQIEIANHPFCDLDLVVFDVADFAIARVYRHGVFLSVQAMESEK
jgi:hypothetical protein